KNIAKRIAVFTQTLANALTEAGITLVSSSYFDTITLKVADSKAIRQKAEEVAINFRYHPDNYISISLDETTTISDIFDILGVFSIDEEESLSFNIDHDQALTHIPSSLTRTSDFLTHIVFNSHHSETQ